MDAPHLRRKIVDLRRRAAAFALRRAGRRRGGRVSSIGLMVVGGGVIAMAAAVSPELGVTLVLGGLGAMFLGAWLLPRW